MKKFLLTATIFLTMMSTGCLQGGSHLIITDDGQVFMRNRLIGVPLIADAIESFRKSFENRPDAEISPVVENNMSGYEVRVHYPSVEIFAREGNSMYTTKPGKCKGIQLKRGFFFDTYDFDLMFTAEKNFSPSEAAAVQSMLSQVSFDLMIELPHAADAHNADKADAENKILTWHLAPVLIGSLVDKHMHVQFKLRHVDNIALTVVAEILLLASTIFFAVKARAEESDSLAGDLRFKRNVFAGLFAAVLMIAAYMLLAPVTFTGAEIISPSAP